MNTLKKVLLALFFSASLHADWIFPPIDIPETNTTNEFLNVGIDASRKAIAVWDFPDTPTQVLSSYWNGSAWSAIETLNPEAFSSRLAVSANGTALAVYMNLTPIPIDATARFWNGTSWDPEQDLTSGVLGVELPNIVMNSNGIGFAIWKESTAGLKTRRWNGSSWDAKSSVPSGTTPENQNIAMNNSGDAVAVWGDSLVKDIKASTWNGSSWDPATNLNVAVPNTLPENNRGLGMDDAGNAMAIWWKTSVPSKLQASFYDKGMGSWTQTPDIADLGLDAVLAVSANGKAIVLFLDNALELKSTTWTGSVWSTPLTVASSVSSSTPINLVADPSGNAVATWKDSSSGQVLASTWDGSEWSTPETLSNVESPMALYNNLDSAINTSGDAVVIWGVQDDTSFKSKAFAADDFIGTTFSSGFFQPISPSDFAGRVEKNKFLTQTEHINFLTWTPSPDTSVVGYRVYQGESIVAEVSSEGPFEATIHSRIKNFPYTYRLVAINTSGQESDPLILNVN